MRDFVSYIKTVFIISTLSFAASEASATILLSATNVNAQTGSALTTLNLNNTATGTSLSFFTPVAETIVITYNAECSLDGLSNQWAAVEIVVDPAGVTPPTVVAPTGTDRAFCSGDAVTGQDSWVSAVAQGVIRVPAGKHTVSVRVSPQNVGLLPVTWRLDDSSIVISDQ